MYFDLANASYALASTTSFSGMFWLAYRLEVALWLGAVMVLLALWGSNTGVSKLLNTHYNSPGEITRRLKKFLHFAFNSLLVTSLMAVAILGIGLLTLARDLYAWSSELAVFTGVLGAAMLSLTALIACLDFASNQTQA